MQERARQSGFDNGPAEAARERLSALAERKDELPAEQRKLVEEVLDASWGIVEELQRTTKALRATRDASGQGASRGMDTVKQLQTEVEEGEEERLAELTAALDRECEILQTIMENTGTHLAYLDPAFNFVRVNEAYAQGSGHSKEELIGRNHFDLFPNPENQAIFEQVRETGEPVEFRARPFEFADQPERGITYWDWALVSTRDSRGQVQGLILSLQDVTERRRAQRALQESEARFRTVADFTHDWEYWIGADGRFIYVSPSSERITGYRPQDFLEEPDLLRRITHPDDRARIDRHLGEERMDGAVHSLDFRIITRSGEERWIGHVCQSVHGRDGEWLGWRASNRDITERKREQKMLQQYADRLKFLHATDQAILTAQSAEEIARSALQHLREQVSCTWASVMLFDLEAGEMTVLATYTDGDTRIPEGWRGSLQDTGWVQRLREGKIQVEEDIRSLSSRSPLTKALQREGVRSLVGVPLTVQGELVGALSLGIGSPGPLPLEELEIAQELADQVAIGIQQARLHTQVRQHVDELEQRVAERTEALQASEARFRAIYEQAAIGISLADMEGRLLATNPALQEMLKYNEDELRGMSYTELTHPDDVAVSASLYEELVTGKRDHYSAEKRYVRKDGEVIWAKLTASLVRGTNDETQYAIGMVEDITEQKDAQAALIQSEKLAITGKLAASLAHEINNPLQTVIGCLGLAEESLAADDREELEEYITMAHEELRRAARIVSRLRDVSRPTHVGAGKPTDVTKLIDGVLKLTRKEFKNRHVEVERQLPEDLPQAVLVPDQMQQVLLNLVLNALDVMPDGGWLKVSASHDSASQEVRLTFADNGPGIPAGVLPNIFDPLFSTKPGGLGLGLFVSQNIVHEHGGRIEVETKVGEGAAFTVCLPVHLGADS